MGKRALLALLLGLLAGTLFAPVFAETTPDLKIYRLGGANLPTHEVLAGKFNGQEVPSLHQALTAKNAWWRVEAQRNFSATNKPMLYLDTFIQSNSTVYLPGSTKPIQKSNTGKFRDFSFSPHIQAIALPNGLQAGESVYWRIENSGLMALSLTIKNEAELRAFDLADTQIRSVNHGALFALVIAGLLISIALRENTFSILAIGMLAGLIYNIANSGDIFNITFLTRIDQFTSVLRLAGLSATALFGYFQYVYLEMDQYYPRLAKFQRWSIAGFVLLLLACMYPTMIDLLARFGNINIIFSGVIGLTAAVLAIGRNDRTGLYYLLSWLPMVFFGVWRVAEVMLGLPTADWLRHAFPASMVFACILLYAGLGQRMLQYKNERDVANKLARIDTLTGVYNRRALDENLQASAMETHAAGKTLALLFVDLDHFKDINDTHGHDVGDQCLIQITLRIRECLRYNDILGRFGGEEFVVGLPNATEKKALEIAERIRLRIGAEPISCGEVCINITASIGICVLHDGVNGLEHALAQADRALYHSKQNGRNCIHSLPA